MISRYSLNVKHAAGAYIRDTTYNHLIGAKLSSDKTGAVTKRCSERCSLEHVSTPLSPDHDVDPSGNVPAIT